MTKRSKGFRHNVGVTPANVILIDWSKYGRTPPKSAPGFEILYHGDGERTWCTASFPIERWEQVQKRIQEQIDFWKEHP